MIRADKKYRKLPKLIAHEIDGEFFVVNDTLGSIHGLGQVDSAVWRLLDEPKSTQDCIDVFRDAFPEEGDERIVALVEGVIDSLEEKGLIY